MFWWDETCRADGTVSEGRNNYRSPKFHLISPWQPYQQATLKDHERAQEHPCKSMHHRIHLVAKKWIGYWELTCTLQCHDEAGRGPRCQPLNQVWTQWSIWQEYQILLQNQELSWLPQASMLRQLRHDDRGIHGAAPRRFHWATKQDDRKIANILLTYMIKNVLNIFPVLCLRALFEKLFLLSLYVINGILK